MPKSQKKSKRATGSRYWFTYAFFTREGQPHPAHRNHNFTHWHGQLSTLLSDLSHIMKTEVGHLGAYVATVWPGQLDEWTALKSNILPLYHVHEGGRLERI